MASRAPWWAWPGTLVVAVTVLATYGRYLVSGLLLAVVLLFFLTVAGVLVWLLAGLARPGRHVSVDGPRATLGALRSDVGALAGRLRLMLGQAPWRRPERVMSAVTDMVCAEVAQLPSGPAAFPAIEVAMNPETIQRLDTWMPIEDVAWHWAAAYARKHSRLPRVSETVTVVVVDDPQVPISRAVVRSGFRVLAAAESAGSARAPLTGPATIPARGMSAVERITNEPRATTPAPAPTVVIPTGTTEPAADHTICIPGPPPGPDPTVVIASGASEPAADHTVRVHSPVPGPTVVMPQAEQRPRTASLELIPAHPQTGEPTTQTPLVVEAPSATIGRAADRDIRLTGSHVSRDHAEIKLLPTGWVVTDRHSTRGTYVDGTPVLPGIPHLLQPGSLVEIGRLDRNTPGTSFRIGHRAA